MAAKKKKRKQKSKAGFFSFATVKTFFKIVAAFALVGLICCIPAYIVVFKVLPGQDPDNQFNRDTIMQVLSGETRVYYEDGNELLGSFFDANHRLYVPYGDIPSNIVNALIAAEDADYWNHPGFDIFGFTRAMISNMKNGQMRQGGSTLTQQTVKNIFGREERSIKEKWKELINALRMERHFSKEEILEFYLNQFHVSGTGKGVAIAAQYFFNKDIFSKDPKDKLTLAECAFIAGSVKGPFNYDPFIQKNEERRERAIVRGRERLHYVLGRMVDQKYITQEEMDEALKEPLKYDHGDFRFTMSTILERVEERLNSDYFKKLFDDNNIDDWHRAQLSITTTIDAQSQDAAKRALQTNISNLQLQLGGYVLPKSPYISKVRKARKGDYLYGAVEKLAYDSKGKLNSIAISFGQLKGIVNEVALKEFSKQVNAEADKVLTGKLSTGSIMLVSVLDETPSNGAILCKIETEPVLQGGLLAIQDGKVIASQGGFLNSGYDRNFQALRQLGSSWKPLLYTLAFKYGWNYQDVLENNYNVFQFTNQFYFPRPDHKNKGDVVTIAWAATKSENIASIWLLDHLLDRLSLDEFMSVAADNGYAQTNGEDTKAYFARLRDKFGLTLKDDIREEIEFTKAKDKLIQTYRAEGKEDVVRALQNLRFGTYNDLALKTAKKDAERTRFINHNYKHYSEILRNREIKELDPDVADTLPPLANVKLFDNFTLADLKRLSISIDPVDKSKNYLDPEYLRYWPDFRRSLSMAEFARFAKEIGIHQKLQKVFSMPLGVNDIHLADITTAYQTIITGKIYKCKSSEEWNEPCLIKEVKDRNNNVIFKDEIESKTILDENVTTQVAAMLHSVFVNGTARGRASSVSVTSPDGNTTWRYPALGKTGTTNDYRNVAFMGAIPVYDKNIGGATPRSVIAIGSYVGFDNNKPMTVGKTRIAGASGGLPQWAAFATDEIKILNIPKHVDFLDLPSQLAKEVPLVMNKQRGELMVDPMTGIAMAGQDASQGGRPIPWLDVPGFIPPQVHEIAAESAAESGFMTSMTMPEPSVPAPQENVAEETAVMVPAEDVFEEAPAPTPLPEVTEKPAMPETPVEKPAETKPAADTSKPAASSDEWSLPATQN